MRIDSGVAEGDEISVFYDPLIAKLITHGETREEAIQRQAAALDAYCIRGIGHNANFLARVMANERFRAGEFDTDFIARVWPDGFDAGAPGEELRPSFIAAAAFIHNRTLARDRAHGAAREAAFGGRHTDHGAEVDWVASVGGDQVPISVAVNDGGFDVVVADATVAIRGNWSPTGHLFEGTINDRPAAMQVDRLKEGSRLTMGGYQVDVLIRHPRTAELARLMPNKPESDLSGYLLSPMPGLVVAINVSEGEDVEQGHSLDIIYAIKMENVLKAERAFRIA